MFVAGLLAVSALSSRVIAAPADVATTLSRTASCAGLNFHPIDSRTTYQWTNRTLWRDTSAGDGWFLCDPKLPNKATVTRVRFTVHDDSSVTNVQYCGLARSGLTASNASSGDAVAMAVVPATGMDSAPGTVRLSDTTISHATIDESNYTYWLQCRVDLIVSAIGAPFAGIIGADVTYTISSTNG
jgi:hypothetical protein